MAGLQIARPKLDNNLHPPCEGQNRFQVLRKNLIFALSLVGLSENNILLVVLVEDDFVQIFVTAIDNSLQTRTSRITMLALLRLPVLTTYPP